MPSKLTIAQRGELAEISSLRLRPRQIGRTLRVNSIRDSPRIQAS
jgi:hypothetical protein